MDARGAKLIVALTVAGALSIAGAVSWAADEDEVNPAALGRTLLEASVPLDRGLQASAREGRPISGKYEAEEGAVQLSVYIARADGFSEVIIDHETGSIRSAHPLTDGDDLAEAQAEDRAMAQATSSLERAAAQAIARNVGYRAWSIFPSLSEGHPVAEITLTNGDEVKKVVEKLD